MLMIKTPFRISLAGGGTDLPSFYKKSGRGCVVSMAINKYMYVMIHPYFHDKLRVKYSLTEDVDSVDELKHPIVRECLRMMEVTSGIEIASIADIPAGLGLGSSSSFTVCLLHALHAYRGEYATKAFLAEQACHIEIECLKEPIGKQDQYAASFGGLNYIQFRADDSVDVEQLMNHHRVTDELMRRLLLFYIGKPRSARDILAQQNRTIGEGEKFEAARKMVELGDHLREAIIQGHLSRVGEIMHEGWQLKKSMASNVTNDEIDEIYEKGLKGGASGGKLLGAGAGGFMLFYCEPEFHSQLRQSLNLRELHFQYDREGSKVIYTE